MKQTYRALAGLVALGGIVQAATIAFGWFDVLSEVENGFVLDENFEGNAGHVLHRIAGLIVIPVLSLILLIVSFFAAKTVPQARMWGGIVFGLTVLQVALAIFGFSLPAIGALHGLNALLPFGAAGRAAMLTRGSARAPSPCRGSGPRGPPPRDRRSLSSPLLRRWRVIVPIALLVSLLAHLGWSWWSSLVPSTYSLAEMGHAEYGGGPAGHDHSTGRPVAELTGPSTGEPDVAVDLATSAGSFRLASGEEVQGYTLNGTSPGPAIEARQGDLVQVTLTNVDVPDGVTLHWHGVDVPNAEDGVADVTQDAVQPGDEHVYRFIAEDAGTYWYHSHQVGHEQVRGGLIGTFVVHPAEDASAAGAPLEVLAPCTPTPDGGPSRAAPASRRWRPRPGSRCGSG